MRKVRRPSLSVTAVAVVILLQVLVWQKGCYAADAVVSGEPEKFPVTWKLKDRDVTVQIVKHSLPAGNSKKEAWSYMTQGLQSLGQPEIVVTVMMKPGEAESKFPLDPLKFFELLPDLARQGKIVGPGGRTDFTSIGFLDPKFRGLMYVKAESLPELPLSGALAALPLCREELAAFNISGPSRVIGRLAKQATYYPYPVWCDRDRQSVFTGEDLALLQKDIFSNTPHAEALYASALKQGNECSLRVPIEDKKRFQKLVESVPENMPVMICLGVDPRANAYLVWSGDPQEQNAVGPGGSDGSKVSAAFLELVPRVKENTLTVAGDGFALCLTPAEWDKFKAAVAKGEDLSLALSSEVATFKLEWFNQ